DIKFKNINPYILTGGVGSGKTTFLRRFQKVVDPHLVENYCLWLHDDFLSAGSVAETKLTEKLAQFCYQVIRKELKTKYKDFCPTNGEELRKLFHEETEELNLTKLYQIQEGSEKRN